MNSSNEIILRIIPFGALIAITVFMFTSKKFGGRKQSSYSTKQPFSNSIKRDFTSSHVTFYDWSSRGAKLQLSSRVGIYAILTSKRPLATSSMEELAKLFDVIETDESEHAVIYTLKKYKVFFDTEEFNELIEKFDTIIKGNDSYNVTDNEK